MISFDQIKNRKLIQWMAAYAAGAWVVLQLVQFLSSVYNWPAVILRVLPVLLAVGALAVIIVAWFHGEKGQQRMSAIEIAMLIGILIIAGGAIDLVSRGGAARHAVATADAAMVEQGSVAVLPFADESPQKNQQYFSDGLTEELRNVLAEIPSLRVAARTSSFAFRDTHATLDSIAKALHVQYLIEGSVRTAGDKVRISATLSEAKTGYQVWTSSYDRDLKDVFAVQEDISKAIVDKLRLKLAPASMRTAPMRTTNTQAHTLLLKALYAFNQKTASGLQSSQQLLEQAIRIDPSYADAYAALASTHWYIAYRRVGPLDENYRLAEQYAQHAIELDSTTSSAYVALGRVYDAYERRFQLADAEYAKALHYNPGNSDAYALRAWLLMRLGRRQDALSAAKRAAMLDPVSLSALNGYGAMLFYAQQYQAAYDAVQSALQLGPEAAIVLGNAALTSVFVGKMDEALRYAQHALAVAPKEQFAITTMAYVLGRMGRVAEARRYIEQLNRSPEVPPYLIATAEMGIGDKEAAFAALERAVATRDDYVGDLGVDPVFLGLHSDRRFGGLLRRLGLP